MAQTLYRGADHMQEEGARVRVMSDSEKIGYQGVTINAEGDEHSERAQERGERYRSGFRVHASNIPFGRVYTFGSSSGWLTRIAIVIALAAILAFLVLVALPVALIGAAIGAVVYIVLSLLRGK